MSTRKKWNRLELICNLLATVLLFFGLEVSSLETNGERIGGPTSSGKGITIVQASAEHPYFLTPGFVLLFMGFALQLAAEFSEDKKD